MLKRATPLAVAVVTAVGVTVTVAQASPATSHHFHQTGVSAGPVPDPTGISAGTLGSSGAIRQKEVPSTTNPANFGGTATVFELQGSFSGTITKGTSNPMTGGQSETVKITSGAGLYKGATGKLTITSTKLSGPVGNSITVTGTLKY